MKRKKQKPKPRRDQLDALFVASEYFEERGELRKAFDCALAAAEGGEQSCQVIVGNCYSEGTGVRRDATKAAYWYRRAYNNIAYHGVRSSSAAHNFALDLYRAGKVRQAIKLLQRALALDEYANIFEADREEAAKLLTTVGSRG